MKTYTAIETAQLLGVAERTVRRWLESGKLAGEKKADGSYAIPESEIERLKLERGDQDSDQDQAARIERLEQELADYKNRLASVEQRLALLEAGAGYSTLTRTRTTREARPVAASELWREQDQDQAATIPESLPAGTLRMKNFAERHNVNRTTLLGHITDGIGRGDRKEHIQDTALPGRTPKEKDRYLTPDQQRAAIAVWKRHGFTYDQCIYPSCPACSHDSDQVQEETTL